ncbi:hypothetical protein QE152_g83 [Popillia japonica]|uniref:Uncharacterized protein n=1 Tax=Popillia japonica TaxID=7064 RepID=A0AAW1NMM5_POPJA
MHISIGRPPTSSGYRINVQRIYKVEKFGHKQYIRQSTSNEALNVQRIYKVEKFGHKQYIRQSTSNEAQNIADFRWLDSIWIKKGWMLLIQRISKTSPISAIILEFPLI